MDTLTRDFLYFGASPKWSLEELQVYALLLWLHFSALGRTQNSAPLHQGCRVLGFPRQRKMREEAGQLILAEYGAE